METDAPQLPLPANHMGEFSTNFKWSDAPRQVPATTVIRVLSLAARSFDELAKPEGCRVYLHRVTVTDTELYAEWKFAEKPKRRSKRKEASDAV